MPQEARAHNQKGREVSAEWCVREEKAAFVRMVHPSVINKNSQKIWCTTCPKTGREDMAQHCSSSSLLAFTALLGTQASSIHHQTDPERDPHCQHTAA